MLETSWSLSLFVAIPILSVAYANLGWRAPFIIQGSLLLLISVALNFVVPKDTGATDTGDGAKRWRNQCVGMGKAYLVSLHSLAAVLLVLGAFFLTLAHHSVFTAYAYYAEEVYQLSTEELGTTQTVIGSAELCGVLAVTLLSDRVGMSRFVVVASAIFAIAIACLIGSSSSGNLGLVLANLFFIYMPGKLRFVYIRFMLNMCNRRSGNSCEHRHSRGVRRRRTESHFPRNKLPNYGGGSSDSYCPRRIFISLQRFHSGKSLCDGAFILNQFA